jgi:hypothetical protein
MPKSNKMFDHAVSYKQAKWRFSAACECQLKLPGAL